MNKCYASSKIFLVGFMGSGKSTVGKKLAKLLGYEFVDLDKQIEFKTGLSIQNYLETYGENTFRELERDLLQHTTYAEKIVIATGGGTPCYFDSMDWMNECGITIYISLPVSALVNRLRNAKVERPLIKNILDDTSLAQFITHKLIDREKFYQKAKFMVSGKDLTAEKLVQYLEMVN